MSSLEICETLKGTGPVFHRSCQVRSGEKVGEAVYDLEVWRSYIRLGNSTKRHYDYVSGIVSGLDNIQLMSDLLTLHLDDERRLNFFIYDFVGRIVAEDGVYLADSEQAPQPGQL